jgi:hypothetical protein
LNLASFLTCQIVFNRFIIAAIRVILLWGDQFQSHNLQISSIYVNCRVWFRHPATNRPWLNSIFTLKEDVEWGFNMIVTQIAHRRNVTTSAQKIFISWNYIQHNSPDQQWLWRRNVTTPNKFGPG